MTTDSEGWGRGGLCGAQLCAAQTHLYVLAKSCLSMSRHKNNNNNTVVIRPFGGGRERGDKEG